MRSTVNVPQDLPLLRHQKGISLNQIAEATKIGVRYLEAIECGQFARLPGGIYNISYIRQYAKAIEVSADSILDCYLQSASIS
jgi:cytoskeletal protein RodZ